MRRGELYRVRRRLFVVVSRQSILDSAVWTVVCAPVYARRDGLATQVELGREDGVASESSIHCDALVSLPKSALLDRAGSLTTPRRRALDQALRVALALS